MNKKLFIVAGMPRTGTTFLYDHLSKHPQVFLPYRKEIDFYTFNQDKGIKWYESLYKGSKKDEVCGDISPLYFLDIGCIQKIKAYSSGAKIILGIRDLSEYAYSLYQQIQTYSFGVSAFHEFVKEGYIYTRNGKKLHIRFDNIMSNIREFINAFQENLFLYDFNCFAKSPLSVLQQIEKFLEIDAFFDEHNVLNKKINAAYRKNIKILNCLLQLEKLISLLHFLPRKYIMKIRSIFDIVSAPKNNNLKMDKNIDQNDIVFLRNFFNSQEKDNKNLFCGISCITGDKVKI